MIRIKVKFFAVLKEWMDLEEIHLTLPERISCGFVVNCLSGLYHEVAPLLEYCLLAVNGSYADSDAVLSDGDELAVLPPVSGG